MNNYLHLGALPVYFIAAFLIYKRREIYKRESLKKISIVRGVIEVNKENIHINDANALFNSLDVLKEIINKNKKLKKDEQKEWKESFNLSIDSLNIDEYDKKTLLSAIRVMDNTTNSYNFTMYSILLMIFAFIVQLTFFILDILSVI